MYIVDKNIHCSSKCISMPDKVKDTKSEKTVVSTEAVPETVKTETPPAAPDAPKKEKSILEPDVIEEKITVEPPKVASFSQLDSSKHVKTDDESAKEEAKTADVKEEVKIEVSETAVEQPAEAKENEAESTDIKEWLKEVRPDTSKESEKNSGPNFKMIILFVIILLILGAVVGGVYYFKNQVSQTPEETAETQEETSPTLAPTSMPAEEVNLKSYSVSVLNGSGVKGEAAAVKKALTDGGFSDEKVATGNADKTNYVKTTVSLKKDISAKVYEEIENALGETYTLEKSETELELNSTYDVIVIVGTKK